MKCVCLDFQVEGFAALLSRRLTSFRLVSAIVRLVVFISYVLEAQKTVSANPNFLSVFDDNIDVLSNFQRYLEATKPTSV